VPVGLLTFEGVGFELLAAAAAGAAAVAAPPLTADGASLPSWLLCLRSRFAC